MTSSLRLSRNESRNLTSRLRRARTFGLVALVVVSCTALAEPYEPARDDTVLLRVPAAAATSQAHRLRRAVASNPQDLSSALDLARAWQNAGRRAGDPRFHSYVQATLQPWIELENPPVEVLVLAATAHQSLHHFTQAQSLLDRALASDPRNAQAWLTKATLLQVQGHFAAARNACTHLIGVADQRIALGCLMSAQGMNGRLAQSYDALSHVMKNDRDLNEATLSWLRSLLGEMAVRLGDPESAERHFETALRADPEDSYARGELADLYLSRSRHSEVVALLKGHEAHDALLLRLAIAGRHLESRAGKHWIQMYDARYQAALRASDSLHLREHARYLLDVLGDPVRALAAAERNWRTQREPADIRLYRHAAIIAGKSSGVIDAWIAKNDYEDATLASERMTEVQR
jgi:tetratricopeptide (TPR) repeat protein